MNEISNSGDRVGRGGVGIPMATELPDSAPECVDNLSGPTRKGMDVD